MFPEYLLSIVLKILPHSLWNFWGPNNLHHRRLIFVPTNRKCLDFVYVKWVILQAIIPYNHHTNSLNISTVVSVRNSHMKSWLGPNNLHPIKLVVVPANYITDYHSTKDPAWNPTGFSQCIFWCLLNSLAPAKCGKNFENDFSNSFYELISWVFSMKLVFGECYRIQLMLSQHWFR